MLQAVFEFGASVYADGFTGDSADRVDEASHTKQLPSMVFSGFPSRF
jgi:hypothetical protein